MTVSRMLRVLAPALLTLLWSCDEVQLSPADTGVADTGAADTGAADSGPPGPYELCAPYSVLGPNPVGVRASTIAGHDVQIFYPAEQAGDAYDAYDVRDWLPPEDAALISDDAAPLFEFPAYRDATAAAGPYPLVLFSHGFGGYSLQSSVLTATIASWGFVVVAPEHPERNLTRVLELDGAPMEDNSAATLLEILDAGDSIDSADTSNIAVLGHSAGGFAAMRVGDDPRIDLVVTWASANIDDAADFSIPSVVMAGENDRLANTVSARQLFDSRASPKQFVVADGLGHLGFSDICLIGRDEGGILEIAQAAGVNVPAILRLLASDGCLPQDRPAEEGWPLINHVTIGNMLHRLAGGDPLDVDELQPCFTELVTEAVSE